MLHAMNYRHAFHAGNHADVLKHIVLLALVDALKRKDTPFFVLDTHAGRGRYLLGGAESRKTSEADEGVFRLLDAPRLPALAEAYLRAVQANNPVGALVAYPGSPLLVAQAMRDQDRLAACELQPRMRWPSRSMANAPRMTQGSADTGDAAGTAPARRRRARTRATSSRGEKGLVT